MHGEGSTASTSAVLVLGGTGEGRELAGALAGRNDVDVTLALAGATRRPRAVRTAIRIGGFGGPEGLARHLATSRTRALVDATHPYAATMPGNAAAAARIADVPRLRLMREPWCSDSGDRWHSAANVTAAAAIARGLGRRPLVTLGARGAGGFAADGFEVMYVRAIEPPADLPSRARWIEARPPFALADERQLLASLAVDVLVTRNAGGPATEAKLQAARELGLPVVVIDRPEPPAGPLVTTVAEAIAWFDQVLGSRHT